MFLTKMQTGCFRRESLALQRCIWLLAAGLLLTGIKVQAQTQTLLYWGASGSGIPLGGSGTWNTSLTDWSPNINGPTYQTWAAGGTKTAVFSGTGGTVTLGSAITAASMIFNADGYTISGGANALTLVNDPVYLLPAIVVSNAGQTATISGTLSGSKGLSVRGLGTLVLTGKSNFTNGTNGLRIVGGTLKEMSVSGSLASTLQLIFGSDVGKTGGGGTFILDNTGAAGTTAQSFAAIVSNAGDATVESDRVAAQNMSITLTGPQSRAAGATINYVVNGGVNGTSNKITLTSQTAGFLDGGTYFSGSNFAWMNTTGGYVRAMNYGVDAGTRTVGTMATVSSTSHLEITGSITAQATGTFTTLKINGANDFAIGGSNSVTVGSLLKTGGNAATLSGGTIQTGTSLELVVRTDLATDALTIGSVIADSAGGASSLTKSGKGTLYLTGSNTYSGPTYLNAGIVSVAALPTGAEASPLGTGALVLSTGTLRYTGTSNVTTIRTVSVQGGGGAIEVAQAGATVSLNSGVSGVDQKSHLDDLMLNGPGTLALVGTDDDSGLYVTVNSGTLILGKDSATFVHAVSALTVNNGGTALLAGTGGDQLYDAYATTVNTGGVLDFNGRTETIDGLNGGGLVTNNSGSANSTVNIGANGTSNSVANGVFDGVIADGTNGKIISVVKSGTGTQVLSGNNTYTGSTALAGGTLQLGNGGTTGSVAGNIDTGQTGATGTLAVSRSDAYTYSGTVLGNGGVNIIGTGTVTLSGINTYTGTTNINAGTVRLGTAGASTTGPLGDSFNGTFVKAGAALDLNGFSMVPAEALSLIGTGQGGAGALTNSSTTAVSYSGVVTIGTGGATIGGTGNISLSAALANTANTLTKSGSNMLTLTTNSTRTGGAIVTGGALRLQSATALGTSAVGLTLNGGNLTLANNSSTTFGAYSTTISAATVITADRTTSSATGVTHTLGALSIGGQTLTVNRGSLITGSGTGGISFGAVTLTADGATFSPSASTRLTLASVTGSGRSFAVTGAGDTVISGAITTGAGSLSKSGGGTLTLSGSSNYSGGTNITGGTLVAGNNNAVGTGAVSIGNGAVFLVPTGVSIANAVTLAGGSYNRQMGSGASLVNAINSTSSIAGGQPDTTATLLDGTTSAVATLQSSFAATSGALNDTIRLSNVFTLSGVPVVNMPTGQTDTFVLQLTVSTVTGSSFLGWLDTNTNTWVNAVAGNIGGTAFFAGDGAYDPLTDFHLGTYGVDTVNHTVWAVVDHNSDFAAVPEPATWGLFIGAVCFMLFLRRRRA